MKRHLVIDGQVFQTPAFYRGMGKYSAELVNKLTEENKSTHEWNDIVVVLSSELEKWKYTETGDIHRELRGVSFISLPLVRNEIAPQGITNKNRALLDEYIEKTFGNDDVDFLMLSPMQGELCSVFPSLPQIYNIALCYDVIPLMFWRTYLQNPITVNEYLTKLKEIFRADAYACISKTCANDLALYLGIDSSRTINIGGGPIGHSAKIKQYNVNRPFFLMPTGNDLRKNNRRAIQAFKQFNELHDNKYQLVITSFFSEHERNAYKQMCQDVVFTGNISGTELNYLYAHAQALLFIPHYEGLGLPILEAMMAEKPVVCSDISVFREVTREGVEFCDQNSEKDIVRALNIVATPGYVVRTKLYAQVLRRYSWDESAGLFRHNVLGERSRLKSYNSASKRSLTVYGSDPSIKRDNLGMLMQYAHAALSRRFRVRYELGGSSGQEVARMNYLKHVSVAIDKPHNNVRPSALYFIDESTGYVMTLLAALANPGVVILASASLRQVWDVALAQGKINDSRYEAERLISSRLGANDSWLGSLVATGSAFLVFEKTTASRIRMIAKRLHIQPNVRLIKMPAPVIPYAETLPAKQDVVATEEDEVVAAKTTKKIRRGDDFSYFDAISRCNAYLAIGDKPDFTWSIAAALGAQLLDASGAVRMSEGATLQDFAGVVEDMLEKRLG